MKQSRKQLNIYLPKDYILRFFFFSFQSHWLQFLPSSCFFYFINISDGISRVPSKRSCWCASLTLLLGLSPEVVQTHSSPQTWTWEHTPGSPSYSGPLWKFISIITYPARPLEKTPLEIHLNYHISSQTLVTLGIVWTAQVQSKYKETIQKCRSQVQRPSHSARHISPDSLLASVLQEKPCPSRQLPTQGRIWGKAFFSQSFPDGSVVKNLPETQEIQVQSGSARAPREENGNPLQYTSVENPMDRGTWWATVHGVAKRVGHDFVTKQQFFFLKPPKPSSHLFLA